MNTRLLRKVQKHILEEPRRLNMDIILDDRVSTRDPKNPPCGTVGCIAGWAIVLAHGDTGCGLISNAAELLSLDVFDGQEARLFNEPRLWDSFKENRRWPKKFAMRYMKAKTPKQRAKVTSDRIDHFIKTRGRE